MVQKQIARAAVDQVSAGRRRYEASLIDGSPYQASVNVARGDDASGQIAGVTAIILPPRLPAGRQALPGTRTNHHGQTREQREEDTR